MRLVGIGWNQMGSDLKGLEGVRGDQMRSVEIRSDWIGSYKIKWDHMRFY